MEKINDALLDAWLKTTSVLINRRMVEGLSFNEAFVCNLLNRPENRVSEEMVTATYLCQETGMLKSQMNKTLNSLEKKDMIRRERSTSDRRKVYIHLVEENMGVYWSSHEDILAFVDCLLDEIGLEKGKQTIDILNMASDVIKRTEKGEQGWQFKS